MCIRDRLNSVHWFFQVDHDCEEDFIDALKGLLQDAHKRILAESAAHADQQGMGTTLTMAHLMWPRMYVVHAGDSRCYLIRDGEARQVTTDHTLARQLVDSGGLKPEEEASSRWSNVLWNVLGGTANGDLIAEVHRCDLREGDTVILCSDGLTKYINGKSIVEVVDELKDPRTICDRLIEMANEAGGEDNITVVVSRPEGDNDYCEAGLADDMIGTAIETTTDIELKSQFETDVSLDDTLPS